MSASNYYLLHSSVDPGGARECMEFLFGTLAEAQLILDDLLWQDCRLNLGLTYCYGRYLRLATVIDGERRQDIDLIPLLTVHGPDGVSFTLDAKSRPIGVAGKDVCAEEFLTAATVHVDWSRVPILELPEPVLMRGEKASSPDTEEDEEVMEWGVNDLEAGEAVGDDFLSWVAEDIAVPSEWLTEAVIGLARGIEADRRPEVMPILADALEEAGCDNEFFLHHCRQETTAHAHGSWLPKLLLSCAAGRGPWL